jgi:microcystin-dependent protein
MSEIPYRYDDRILYKNKDGGTDFEISEKDLYRLNHYWFEGQVVWYYGDIKKIPKGWALCDGKNGTPDLRDKFVVGSSDTIKMEQKGGKETVVLTEDDLPKHSHRFNPYMIDKGNNYFNDKNIQIDICPDLYSLSNEPDENRCPLNPSNGKNPGGPCCYGHATDIGDANKAKEICINAGGNWVNDYITLDFWKNPYVCMMPNTFKKYQYKCPDNTLYWVGTGADGSPLGKGGKVVSEADNSPFNPTLYNKTVDCSPLTKKPEHSVYNDGCVSDIKTGVDTNCKSFIPLAKENTFQGSEDADFESVGDGKPHNNIPPYFSLYYIIKLKKEETN